MKILPVGAELFRADGRTDMTKLRVAFRNFAKASKKVRKMFDTLPCTGIGTASHKRASESCTIMYGRRGNI